MTVSISSPAFRLGARRSTWRYSGKAGPARAAGEQTVRNLGYILSDASGTCAGSRRERTRSRRGQIPTKYLETATVPSK